MDRKHRDILITKRCELLENLNVGDGLFTELITRKILSPRMVRKIKNGKSPDEQAEDLLDILPTRGPLCFKEFCESLIANNQEHIVTLYLKPEKNEKCAITPVEETRGQKRPRSPSPNRSPHLVCIKDDLREQNIVLKFFSSYAQKEKDTCAEKRQFVPNELRHSLKHFTISHSGVKDFQRYIPVDSYPQDVDQISNLTKGYHQHMNSQLNEPYSHQQRNISAQFSKGNDYDPDPGRHNTEGSDNMQMKTVINNESGSGQTECHSAGWCIPLNTRANYESRSGVNNCCSDIGYNQKNTSSDNEKFFLKTNCQSSARCGHQDNNQPSQHDVHHSCRNGKSCTETYTLHTPLSKHSDSITIQCTNFDNENFNTQRDRQGPQIPQRSPNRVNSQQAYRQCELQQDDQQFSSGHHLDHQCHLQNRISHQSSSGHHLDHHIRKDHQQSVNTGNRNQRLSHQNQSHMVQNLEESLQRNELQDVERRISLPPLSHGQSFHESTLNPDAIRNQYVNGENVQRDKDPPHSQLSFYKKCTETVVPISPDRVTRNDSIDTIHTVLPRPDPVVREKNSATDVLKSGENLEQQVLVDNMVDNDIDLTDGPVHVRVDSSTREFYLENYKQAYPMKKLPRGEALIINVNEIKGKPPRLGTDIDRDNMHSLLLQLHFNVTLYNDKDGLTAMKLYEKVAAFAASDKHENSNACFVCLLSHGEEGYIYGTDGQTTSLSDIFSLFDNNRCKGLCGKPKIFIIQACRGGSFDRGVTLDEIDGSNSIKIPTFSDVIIGYPTQAGYYAWRNRERGSWYIEAIVQVFMKHAKKDDICTLLNRVNAVVSMKISRAAIKEMDQMSQMSEYKSSLRMPHVYLFPGIGSS